jgi:hypothetical protein
MTEADVAEYVRRGRAARIPTRSSRGAFNRFLGFLHESGRIDWQHGNRLVQSLFHTESPAPRRANRVKGGQPDATSPETQI